MRSVVVALREVAAVLGVAMSTVYQLCAAGKLAHVRVPNALRVEPEAAAAYLAGRRGP